LNCLVCYDLERVLKAYEAIDAQVPIRDKRWVVIHIIEADIGADRADEEARRHRDRHAELHVHGERPLQSAEDRRACNGRSREMLVRVCGGAVVGQRAVFDAVDDVEALARFDRDSNRSYGKSNLSREEALRMITQTGPLLTWERQGRERWRSEIRGSTSCSATIRSRARWKR
jgi:hypothetical protein